MKSRTPVTLIAAILASGCASAVSTGSHVLSVGETPTTARAPTGAYIAWHEHRIDDQDINGGLPLRGGDGLQMADIDRDGFIDIVSVHEDSHHLRIAFGTADPDRWVLTTVASGDIVAAIEDVAVGDLDGDGWLDLVTANEEGHLAYFQNPGSSASARAGRWRGVIPNATKGRGSWLRVFIADINGDGRPDVTAANKGASDIVDPSRPREDRTTSLFTITGNPLDAGAWSEQVLFARGIPNTAMPVDIDGDGDLDVLAASRLEQRMYVLENRGLTRAGQVDILPHPVTIDAPAGAAAGCDVASSGFQSQFRDLDGDGRLDLIVGVIEDCGDARAPNGLPALGWLRQPSALGGKWLYYRIGDILPDTPIGIDMADIDGDGDLDAVTGGYSGLNILAGGYTTATREQDHPGVTPASTAGRIAWFANPGDLTANWTRHDIWRRVRGMFDQFIARDMNGDGTIDLVSTRGNSGRLDGVFWLEQVRTTKPAPSFTTVREIESRALQLPSLDWIEHYERDATLTPPRP